MRVYTLPINGGVIRATFAAELDALSLFPEDEISLRQAQSIISDENERLQRLGADYVPSKLSLDILRRFDKSVTERATCALMAIALLGLDDIGESMNQRRAAAVVSEYSNSDHGTTLFRRIGSGIAASKKALTGDHKKIETLFRKHRAVAHILAARAVLADNMELQSTFISTAQTDLRFLSTVLYLQDELSKAENFENWNSWKISVEPSSEAARLPTPWLPKSTTIDNLLEPWLAAGKPILD